MKQRIRVVDLAITLSSGLLLLCNGQSSFPQATQQNTYGTSYASRAIDGNVNTCSLSAYYLGAPYFGWWQVDLGGIFTVVSVTLTTNTDSNTHDGIDPRCLQDFTISVGTTNSTDMTPSSPNLCYYFNNGSYLQPLVPLALNCTPNPLEGRYITIERQGGIRQDAIGICEVNIQYYPVSTSYSPTSLTTPYITPSKPSVFVSSASNSAFPENTSILPSSTGSPQSTSSSYSQCSSGLIAAVIILAILLGLSLAVNVFQFICRLRQNRRNGKVPTTEHKQDEREPYEKLRLDSKAPPNVQIPVDQGGTERVSVEQSPYEEIGVDFSTNRSII